MSKTDDSVEQYRNEIGPQHRGTVGSLRRMSIGHSSGVRWQVVGHRLVDSKTRETRDVEVFPNPGFFSRPRHDDLTAEAIVLFIAGSDHPVIIAGRDEAARAAAAALELDETCMFNSSTRIIIKQNGTVEISTLGGNPRPLAFKSDVDDLWDKYNHHIHGVTGSNTTQPNPADLGGPAGGTHCLKSE